jgi:hypothetical protein
MRASYSALSHDRLAQCFPPQKISNKVETEVEFAPLW